MSILRTTKNWWTVVSWYSFDIVTLVGESRDAYEIEIGADDIVPENFNSVEAIMALVTKLQED